MADRDFLDLRKLIIDYVPNHQERFDNPLTEDPYQQCDECEGLNVCSIYQRTMGFCDACKRNVCDKCAEGYTDVSWGFCACGAMICGMCNHVCFCKYSGAFPMVFIAILEKAFVAFPE